MKSLPMSSAGSKKLPGCFKGTGRVEFRLAVSPPGLGQAQPLLGRTPPPYRVGATIAVALAGQASLHMRCDNLSVREIHMKECNMAIQQSEPGMMAPYQLLDAEGN